MQLDLTPYIQSHYTQGVPAQELIDNKKAQKRLNDLFSVYDMYCENPCMDVRKALQYRFKHSYHILDEDMVYFEFIRTTFTRMTRQKAQDLVNWSAEKALRDSAAVNDRKGMLDAAKVLGKFNQLDKPEPEKEDKVIRPLSVIFTPYVEVLDPDRHTIKDKTLLQYMHQYGAHIDAQQENIEKKLELIHASQPDPDPDPPVPPIVVPQQSPSADDGSPVISQ